MTIQSSNAQHLVRITELLNEWTTPEESKVFIQHIKADHAGNKQSFHSYIVEDETGIVGVGAYSANHQPFEEFGDSNKTAIIDILYLSAATRGKGYGSELLTFLRTAAQSEGYKQLLAKSAGTQCPAYDFFGHKGFTQIGSIEAPSLIIVFSQNL